MTEQQQTPAQPSGQQAPPVPTAPPSEQQATPPGGSEKQPPWGSDENFNPAEAWKTIQNLRKEKAGPDPQLRSELDNLRQSLASALGVKPEETSDTDKLAQQVDSLRDQIVASERRALAVEFKVPPAMLTATTADEMRAQAVALVEFAQGAHVAASAAAAAPPPPEFAQNPGQGQSGSPQEPGYEQFYDPSTGRPRFQ